MASHTVIPAKRPDAPERYTYQHIGRVLRTERRQQNLTQRRISELSGLPRTTVARIEAGGNNMPFHRIAAYAHTLNLSLDHLIGDPP